MISAGTVLKGKYKVVRLLKSGGMGFVHEGEYNGTKCIIKEPKPGEEIKESNYYLEKLKIEAEILSKVKHDNIVGYIDSFEQGNSFFLVEEYVEGEKLGDKYFKKPGSEDEVISYTLQLLDAVEYLHNIHIKHRDINPNNLILTPEKKLVLIDFGTAKYIHSGQKETNYVPKSTKVGTPYYAPPEQWEGDTSEVSDIFSIGRNMYFMLTGEHPTESPYKRLDFLGTKISKELAKVVLKATAPEIKDRYSKVVEMIASLKRIKLNSIKSDELEDIPKKNRKWLTIGIGILTTLIILFIVFFLLPKSPSVVVVDVPVTVETGSPFKITWKVNSNAEYQIDHTAIHYGPESQSEPLTLTSYTNISNVYGGLIPATFSSNITINTPGVIYFRAHAIINNVNYWSEEKRIVVSEQPPPVTPTIEITDAPPGAEAGSPFKITWRVNSNVEYQINHTAIHYGPESQSEPLTLTSYTNISNVYGGLIPATFSSNITINTPGVIYFRAHAIINNVNYWSEEKRIVVSEQPPPVTPTIEITDAPVMAETGSPFKITWRVNSNVEYQINHTAIHYGPESQSEPLTLTSYTNISNVYGGLIPATFSSNITINTPGVIYFRAHAIIDNVNYWSEEKNIVVSTPAQVTPSIQVTSFPSSVKGDTNFTIRWKVSGGTPGQIRYTLVHWGWNSGGPNSQDYPRISQIQNGYTPAEFSVDLESSLRWLIFFRAHAMVDDTDLYSPEYQITIIA